MSISEGPNSDIEFKSRTKVKYFFLPSRDLLISSVWSKALKRKTQSLLAAPIEVRCKITTELETRTHRYLEKIRNEADYLTC